MTVPSSESAALFEAAKSAALPGVWNQGVKLARQEAARLASQSASELVVRVQTPGRAVPPTVVLYGDEQEWTCDCGSRNDPCEHAVAAVIAWHQAKLEPAGLAASRAELHYRLDIGNQKLKIRRFLRIDADEHELTEALTTLVTRGACPYSPSEDDIQIDRLLLAVPRADFSLAQLRTLLRALEGKRVSLSGQPIQASREPLMPVARVFDQGDKIVLHVSAPPGLERVLVPGLALAEGVLRPIGAVEIVGLRMEELPLERSMKPSEAAELVDRVLPELSKSLEVEIETSRLPTRSRTLKPRIAFDLTHQGHTLSVLPTLVYGDPPVARVDGDRLVLLGKTAPRRERVLEQNLIERLRGELNLALGRRVHFDGPEAARFAERLRRFAAEPDRATAGALASIADAPMLTPRLALDADSFDVRFEATPESGQSERASSEAVLRAFRDGAELVPLERGGFASIPKDWLGRFGERIASLLAMRDQHGSLPTFAIPTLARLCEELGEPAPPRIKELAPLFESFESLPPLELPEGLRATLRPYQVDAVRWLRFLKRSQLGAVLADDMGLGKTLQTLCAIDSGTLVVCPKSVLFNWEREIARFRPGLTTSVYHGPGRRLDPRADITLTSYALLRLDAKALSERRWDSVVLDEAQAIKNPQSRTAQAAFALKADFRVALSGTPIENRLDELWSIFRFTHPGLLGTRSSFDERFAVPIAAGKREALERLRELTKPFLLRRLKKVVAKDLPPLSEAILPIELDETERQLYDSVLAATKREVVQSLKQGGSVLGALEALLRLRQAACHSGLLPGQHAESSSKVEALVDALCDATADGHKALVFSQWTSFLDRIEPHLAKENIAFARLDGKTRDRARVVEEFQSDAGPPVLLASLKAGGTGLNLTAADHVFLMDPWYNPATEAQAADRAHRIGQDRPVMVYKLVARGTVEEGISLLQEKKKQLADAALAGAEGATAITRADLLALLE